MLLCMKHGKIAKKLPREGPRETVITNDREDAEERDMQVELEGVDTDGK